MGLTRKGYAFEDVCLGCCSCPGVPILKGAKKRRIRVLANEAPVFLLIQKSVLCDKAS